MLTITPRSNHVEGADQVDVYDAREVVEGLDAFTAEHAFGGRDSGGVHDAVQLTKVRGRRIDRFLDVSLLCDIALHEASGATQLGGFGTALLVVQVEHHRTAASGNHHVDDRAAKSGRAARDEYCSTFDLHGRDSISRDRASGREYLRSLLDSASTRPRRVRSHTPRSRCPSLGRGLA